jgi:hypothetical protein
MGSREHTEWRKDSSSGARGIIEVDSANQPRLLVAKNASDQNEDIVYGSAGDDNGDNRLDADFADINSPGFGYIANYSGLGNDLF